MDEERSQILIFGGRSASEMKLQDLYAWVSYGLSSAFLSPVGWVRALVVPSWARSPCWLVCWMVGWVS